MTENGDRGAVEEARRALRALALEAPEPVAARVTAEVEAAFAELARGAAVSEDRKALLHITIKRAVRAVLQKQYDIFQKAINARGNVEYQKRLAYTIAEAEKLTVDALTAKILEDWRPV